MQDIHNSKNYRRQPLGAHAEPLPGVVAHGFESHKSLGLALHRISSVKQTEGHSLEAQETSTTKMASDMNVPIISSWSSVASSRKGKNLSRKDLLEVKQEIRRNNKIKYLFVDRVNRLMREWKMMLVFIIELEQMGVKVIFCDPSQQYLNGDDQFSQLLLIIEGFKAEQENKERAQTSASRMKSRYEQGYYLSHPHPGYIKSEVPGLHIPDPSRFDLLKEAGRQIIYKHSTVNQAVKWLNDEGYRNLSGRKIDVNRYSSIMINRYYCGYIDINSEGWPKNIEGLHEPMFSKREHGLLVKYITKRNPRTRINHNPEFPMANLLSHEECLDSDNCGKFTGTNRNPGKTTSGKPRKLQAVYDCRSCRKRLSREKVHSAISRYLEEIRFSPSSEKFKKALVKAWRQQRGSSQSKISSLKANRGRIQVEIEKLVAEYVSEKEGPIKNTIKNLVEDKNERIKNIDVQIHEAQSYDLQSDDFVKFAFDFVEKIREKWWHLSYEDRLRGEQILFNGNLIINNSATVRPHKLSSIYRLGSNKKALSNSDNAHLEEHIEKSSPLIVEEIARWRDLLWEDYFDYQREKTRLKKLKVPSDIRP